MELTVTGFSYHNRTVCDTYSDEATESQKSVTVSPDGLSTGREAGEVHVNRVLDTRVAVTGVPAKTQEMAAEVPKFCPHTDITVLACDNTFGRRPSTNGGLPARQLRSIT